MQLIRKKYYRLAILAVMLSTILTGNLLATENRSLKATIAADVVVLQKLPKDKQSVFCSNSLKKWQQAADKSIPEAEYLIGRCYIYGHGVKKDYKQAVKWFKKAAEQGDARAQNALGLCTNAAGWPFGVQQEWNDINPAEELYYVIEYNADKPDGLNATQESDNYRIKLEWNDNSDNEDGFRIIRTYTNSEGLDIEDNYDIPDNDETITEEMEWYDVNAVPNTAYTYRVLALLNGTESQSASPVVSSLSSTLDNPTNLTIQVNPEDISLNLTWVCENQMIQ